jgi:hypothetical protein
MNKRIFFIITIIIFSLLLVIILLSPNKPNNKISSSEIQSFSVGFESGEVLVEGLGYEAESPERFEIVSDVVRKGDYAMKVTLYPDDIAAKKNRVEFKRFNEDPEGSEGWYSWSFFIPEDYIDPDESLKYFQIIGQWHDQPPEGVSWNDFPSHSPPISVNYGTQDGQSGIGIGYGINGKETIGISEIEKGEWYDILFHVKWSQGEEGFAEVWLNGKKIAEKHHGPNMYNSEPNYLKLGLYRKFGFETINSVYYDELRMGNTREEVEL